MFSVKGLPSNTGLIKPAPTTLAIAEIIIMVTVAFLLGFGMAWIMRTEPLEAMTYDLQNSKYEIRDLEANVAFHKQEAEKAANARSASDEQAARIAELETSERQARDTNRDLQTKIQILEGEINSSKFRIRVLEGEVTDKSKAIGALTQELENAGTTPKVEHREWSDHPFVRPIEISSAGDERDDLTDIKGVGPAFQKKLNLLDIYSFRQLSELDGEAVERLAEVIEVFPERIHRDNWIGQATKLYMKKLGRED
jgi:predicted flap endonuclease-1-like 5' DNA nuclease